MINKTNNGAVIHIDNSGLKHYYSNSRRRQLYNYLESIKSKHGLTKIRLSTAMGMSEKYLANKAGEGEFSKFGDLERQTYSSIRSEVECAVLLLTDLSLVDSEISIKKPPNILSRDDVLRVLREKLNYSHAQYVGDHIILTDDKP